MMIHVAAGKRVDAIVSPMGNMANPNLPDPATQSVEHPTLIFVPAYLRCRDWGYARGRRPFNQDCAAPLKES